MNEALLTKREENKPIFYSFDEVVAIFGVSAPTLRKWTKLEKNPLKVFKIGKVLRFTESDLMNFFNANIAA